MIVYLCAVTLRSIPSTNTTTYFDSICKVSLHCNKQGISLNYKVTYPNTLISWAESMNDILTEYKTLMSNWFDKLIIQVCKRADQLFVNLTFKFNQMVTGLSIEDWLAYFVLETSLQIWSDTLHGRTSYDQTKKVESSIRLGLFTLFYCI